MRYFLLISLPLLFFISCQPATQEKAPTSELASHLDSLFTAQYEAGSFNGSVLLAEKGKILFQKGYGLANEKTGAKINAETVFELASVSKQFTAMGIVQLQKEGKLSYDDEVATYIQELQEYPGVTIRNLLNHTGGLPDYMELADEHWDHSKIATNDDMLKLFEELLPERDFEPNQEWDYSNTGYMLLATIIERVSGKSFGEYLNDKIFKPLGMANTFVYRRRYQPKEVSNYAQGYVYGDSTDSKVLPDEVPSNDYVIFLDGILGDGMVNSNVIDLLKWDQALYTDKLINDQDKELIFTPAKLADGSETDYGFGWTIEESKTYGKIAHHSGGWAGYITYIERHLDHDKTIIILQNQSIPKTKIPVKNTRKIAYGIPIEKPIQLGEDILKTYAGKYLTESQKERQVLFEEGKLFLELNPETQLELVPVSTTKFIVDGFSPEVSITFIPNKEGKVEAYRIQQPEQGVDRLSKRTQ
ncbi:MAG: serine hydrolase [Bacteroidota bacterium]